MISNRFVLLLSCLVLLTASCGKDESPTDDFSAIKKSWVTGSWKQQDILLAVSTTVSLPNGTRLPLQAGSSMINDPTINALLGALFGGNPFVATRDNRYHFKGDESYEIAGASDFILPGIATQGAWKLEVYDAVVALYPSADKRHPYWVNAMTATQLDLSLTLNFPGLGAVPLKLVLEKE